jgi:cellulose synthase/poly-beta-1,6-N-acetylglucosamine synthase-like glycosyltransferase
MLDFGSLLLLSLIILMAVPVLVFCFEIIAAVLLPQPRISKKTASQERCRVGVLIPAHNESTGLRPTIENVKSQLGPRDRLLVVADNCTDDTSAVAASLGVEVIDRQDPLHIGKGYALDLGIKHLALNPPEVLIVVDADCTLSEGSIDYLASVCCAEHTPDDFPGTFQLAEFAWRVKNWVRPLGLRALRLPCQLTGTGMAFPWDLIRFANLASGEIVEDLKLGLDLARGGNAALFCPPACVVSYFPTSQEGIDSQRQRWQKGHLNMIARLAPRMFGYGIIHGNIRLFMLALDLTVPPLFLLALIQTGLLLVCFITAWFGGPGKSFYLVLTTNILLVLAIVVCWINFGRDIMPAQRLLLVPLLAWKRLLFYHRIVFGRRTGQHWVRTDRSRPKPPSS